MTQMTLQLDDLGGGKATTYFRGKRRKSYTRVSNGSGPDAEAQWFDATKGTKIAVGSKTKILLENTYRNPTKTNVIRRFPRLEPEDAATCIAPTSVPIDGSAR